MKTAGRKTCGFESGTHAQRGSGLRSTNNKIVLWPSGEGTCLTNRGSTVRIRPGLLFNDRHQSVWRGRCLQNILSEFESRWCLSASSFSTALEGHRTKRTGYHGPSVQSGVDATLSRWRSPVQIRYGSLTWCGTPTAERLVLGTSVCEFESRPHY